MRDVTKRIFLASLDCPGMAWLLRNSEDDQGMSEAGTFRMDQGREIGALARDALDGGVFVRAPVARSPAEYTAMLVADRAADMIYEATFEADGLIARADVLRREPAGWCLIEVKSKTRNEKQLVPDLAYTVMVARRSGLPVSRAVLMLVSKDYRLGMPLDDLFVQVDRTGEIDELVPDFVKHWETVRSVVQDDEEPTPDLSHACGRCAYYSASCIGEGVGDPLFDLPRLHASKFEKLRELGVTCIGEIPADFVLTEKQERVRQAAVSGESWISSGLTGALEAIEWPAHYLDFETTATAMPLFAGVAPYEQIPTQYSIHLYSNVETELHHREFLADHRVDDRRRLAETLLTDLGESGSIVVYTSFERRVLQRLAELFADLAPHFERCLDRLFDLEAVIKSHYYHPEFHGSSSIKRTLPVLVPEMNYDVLAIGNGADASALFARMARGEKTEAECEEIRANLLQYCRQDTLAMARLHKTLLAAAG